MGGYQAVFPSFLFQNRAQAQVCGYRVKRRLKPAATLYALLESIIVGRVWGLQSSLQGQWRLLWLENRDRGGIQDCPFAPCSSGFG